MLGIVAAALGLGAITWVTLTSGQSQPPSPAAPVREARPVVALQAAPASAGLPNVPFHPGPAFSAVPAATLPVADTHTPVMIIDNSAPPAANPGKTAAQGGAPLLDANDQFAARFGAASDNKPSRIADPAHTIPQGAVIPAVLETALNSDLPGFARAIVSRDVKGFDGSVVLVPRGSRLIGQYKSGLSSGVTRAFVIWERLIRPDGVSIQLGSPVTDEIGQTGLSGDVDSHFLKRFGAAMLLSVVNGLVTSHSGTAIVFGASTGGQGASTDALGVDARIPPTVRIAQGTVIQVFVAHDLPFGE
jgi:type IV secretion system protein VirB10